MSTFMVKGFKKLNLIKKNLENIKKWNVYLRVCFLCPHFINLNYNAIKIQENSNQDINDAIRNVIILANG